ncbi:putative inactive shikimate kinase like 2, chloroplastic [Iris pallida]|uniref:Inactive shikimate kinase like 2, chloroplastic n=1 Tax=Iris pallida TaxID=29817 RepID=A0AAX6IN33_IRIPA|nr:putative inactive shikimate kinase like 2, chloroplastic [Iris pallida]
MQTFPGTKSTVSYPLPIPTSPMATLPLPLSSQNPNKTLKWPTHRNPNFSSRLSIKPNSRSSPPLISSGSRIIAERFRCRSVSSRNVSSNPPRTRNYEFNDADTEVELRLDIGSFDIESSKDIFVDADETSLLIRVKASGTLITLMETARLFEKIKPGETIWYLDEDQLVVNLKKYDNELKWPDVMESWETLASGLTQLLKGTSIYLVGESTEINLEVAKELAVGLGYTPLNTSDLLERYAKQSIDSWVISDGADSVAQAEGAILEGLSSHARTVVATLGGEQGAAMKDDKWRHLHAGFTVWLSNSGAGDGKSAREEARRHIQDGSLAYTNADVVVKLGRWDREHSKVVAQACLSALKQLILSDKQLTGKKSLYIRLGCRGDWPNIKAPGWNPSSNAETPEA